MDKYDINLPKLRAAIDYTVQVNETFRTNMVEFILEYAGGNWAHDVTTQDADRKVNPINLLSMYVTVINRRLVGNEPRMMVSTFDRDLRPMVEAFEEWGNRRMKAERFVELLRSAVMNATFLMGIARTCISSPLEARMGYGRQPGQVIQSLIGFGDYLFDVYARCFDECEWKGHQYCVDLEEAQSSKLFDKKARKELQAADDTLFDSQGNRRIGTLSRFQSNDNEYRKKVWLREVWIRKENVVVTFDALGHYDEPLLVQEWIGPDSGPYDELYFGELPEEIMPKAPVMDLIDLHREQNQLWRQLANQASNQKSNILYRDEQVAEAHKKAKDQDYIRSQDPQGLVTISTGGPNNMVQAFSMLGYQMFNDIAGNIKAVAGLGKQADTLGQEKIITENASEQIQAMSIRTAQFAERLMIKRGWFFWHNPHETMRSSYSVPGLPDVSTERIVTPIQRMSKKFEDMDIRIDPYTLTYMSPGQKAAVIDNFVKNVFIPMAPMFNQPGIADFLQAYVKKVAKLMNMPELIELMEVLVGAQQKPEGEPTEQGMPNETTRNYNRTSQPGATESGQSQVMQQLLAGGNPQGQNLGQQMAGGM